MLKNKLAKKLDSFIWYYSKILARIIKKLIKIINKYNKFIMRDDIYFTARKITKPLHWLWIFGWLAKLKQKIEQPFTKPGVYIISGEPGAGKSSLAYQIMERDRLKNNKGSYINTAIEKPRVDYEKMKYYKYHQQYEITDFFKDNKIICYPNQYDFNAMHVDESHRIWNYRNNMQSDYKESFIPFMEYAVGVRHYIGRIFLYTQLDKVDTQLMSLGASNFYTVKKKLGFDYMHWYITGKFELTIKGWNIKEYVISDNKKKEIDSFFIDRTFDIEYFDTFNLRKDLDYSKMQKANITKVRS